MQTSPDKRWSPERKRSYGQWLVNGFKDCAASGEKLHPVYLTLNHVVAYYTDATNPIVKAADGSDVGGYGFKPIDLGLMATDVSAGLAEFVALWVAYVKAAWPDHPQTPGAPPRPPKVKGVPKPFTGGPKPQLGGRDKP